MKKLRIEPGCVSCGTCAFLAPEVFEMKVVAILKKDADLRAHDKHIKEAAYSCPVQVIKYEE